MPQKLVITSKNKGDVGVDIKIKKKKYHFYTLNTIFIFKLGYCENSIIMNKTAIFQPHYG